MFKCRCSKYTTTHQKESKKGFWRNLNKMEDQTVSHTHTVLYIQAYILSVRPPVVAVPRGATIIQPSVVKTESDVMRTVKQP